MRVYYEVNPCYIDTLSKQAVGAFIREIYDAYWERFGEAYGSVIRGVFTDEPQFARRQLPWSFELAAVFEQRCGYPLLAHLPALFMETEGCRKVRYDYWLCVTEMFTEAYAKQIGEWCGSRGWSATGHVVDEQTLMDQVTAVGDPMSFYEYLQIPGCDWLGRLECQSAGASPDRGMAARARDQSLVPAFAELFAAGPAQTGLPSFDFLSAALVAGLPAVQRLFRQAVHAAGGGQPAGGGASAASGPVGLDSTDGYGCFRHRAVPRRLCAAVSLAVPIADWARLRK
uniref:Predicted protein n=1 Tax=Physcomitrium patens TaxID=3218 RepID=A9U804_PHYPA